MHETDMGFAAEENLKEVEKYTFDLPPIKGYPELRWAGKRPFRSTRYYPAQLKETHGEPVDGWINELYWGDNLQVMSHLLKKYRGKIKLIYIDPPFDSKAEYKKKITLRGKKIENDRTAFEEKQYTDIWTNDEYLQFMYERLIILRELLAEEGSIYIHCDWRVNSHLRIILDEVFGKNNFLNQIVWCYQTRQFSKRYWNRKHDDIIVYTKTQNRHIFNWNVDGVIEPYSENTIKKFKLMDENGYYRLCGRGIAGSPIKSAKDVDPIWEKTNPELVVRNYLGKGFAPPDYWRIDIVNQAAFERSDYPTQKPEALLEKIIKASSNPGDLVADFFMGSGTTQAVAMKLGRRFIGADINLGAIQTTTKRLLNISQDLQENGELSKQQELYTVADRTPDYENTLIYFTGFSLFNVNNYDVFKNPVQAKELLIEALEIQKLHGNSLFDGEKDGRMIKIMPVNRIATRADLNELISNLDYKAFEKRKAEQPNKPVEHITLVCMGHELDLQASFLEQVPYDVDIDIVDILRDRKDLQFRHEAEAEISIENGILVIKSFYPMNLLQKLSMERENVEDWREMVESIMIDFNYDGSIFEPKVVDIPEKNALVTGKYSIPDDVGRIRIKITDVLSESFEKDV